MGLMTEIYDEAERYRIALCEANAKVDKLQAERDMLEDLVGEKEQEFADYKKHFKTEDELRAELEQYRWIPVGERLPKKNGRYLVLHEDTGPKVCHKGHSAVINAYDFDCQIRYATHWKPIIPPKEDENETN